MADPTSSHRSKRKRYEGPQEKDVEVKITGKLHHASKEVRKVAKKVKTFETQKLVKKLKGLRQKGGREQELKDCEAQLEFLKRTDHEPIANAALKAKVKKDRTLSENEHILDAVAKELDVNLAVPAPAGTPAAKVQGRLLSSKTLAAEVSAVLEGLRNIILPKEDAADAAEEEDDAEERPRKTKKTAASTSEDVEMVPSDVGADVNEDASHEDASEAEDLFEGAAEEDDPAEANDDGWESGTVGDDEKEDDWDSDSQNEPSAQTDEAGTSAESDAENSEDAKPQHKPPKEKPPPPAGARAKVAPAGMESTFLPSLAVGFVRGGSDDSDWSDSEAKIADGDQKKNRRGQRARRAIWEKKYGRNANHKKKEQEASQSYASHARRPQATGAATQRDRSGPAKASSIPDRGRRDRKPAGQHHQQADGGWEQRTEQRTSLAQTAPPKSRPARIEDKPLHPSWAAKKLLKEKQSAAILPPQGKKIVFT